MTAAPRTLGAEIKALRDAREMTQSELAEQLRARGFKCQISYISKIENDRQDAPPSEEMVRAIAEILRADAQELLGLYWNSIDLNQRVLQSLVNEMPEAGVLLRRMQARKIPRSKLKKWVGESEGE